MPESVLVTGASGFLGRYAAREWSRAGWRVVGIGRDPWDEAEWRAWGLSAWLCADLSLETLSAFAGVPEVVAHCAGGSSVGASFQAPEADFQSTLGTLLAALEFLRLRAPAARLVYPSSAAVYGQVERLPIDEDDPLRPASPYGTHKLMAEDLCRSHARHFGLNVAVVRFFSLYGEGLRKQLLWDACLKFSKGEAAFLGTGEELRDWLHVEDAARLLRVAAAHADGTCPVVNGASGTGTSVRQVLSLLRSAFPEAPPLAFTSVAKAGDPSAYVASCGKAFAWDWHPAIHLEQALGAYAAWFLRERR